MRALEEMGWLPEFVTGRVWRCAKWSTSQAVARPYAGLEELGSFARGCDGRAQWTVYGMAVLSFTCLLRVGEAAPIRRGGSCSWGGGCHTVTSDAHFALRKPGGYGRAWTVRGPRPQSHWRTFARKGPPTSRWSWQPPSAAVKAPTRNGTRGRGSAALRWLGLPVRLLAWWGRWMSELVAAHYGDAPNDFVVATWNCRGPVHKGT